MNKGLLLRTALPLIIVEWCAVIGTLSIDTMSARERRKGASGMMAGLVDTQTPLYMAKLVDAQTTLYVEPHWTSAAIADLPYGEELWITDSTVVIWTSGWYTWLEVSANLLRTLCFSTVGRQ